MKSKVHIKKKPKAAIERIEKIVKSLRGPDDVVVGLPKGSNNYPDGTSVVMVGTVHEFGSPARGIPARSFLRTTMVEGKRKYKNFMGKLAKSVVDGKRTKAEALVLAGAL